MGYEVLARKWRPQNFDDVVGQDHVTQTLRNAITLNRLAHAYLFVGPRGIGKTSIARIFAKCMNCQEGPTGKPCGTCDACVEIAGGRNLDVIEIDGASNNGVDQVRELRDTVMYAPNRGPYKIYIIDEVHMLSIAAFNALLKTLEEPPAHVKFIFATTEAHKVLPTVISRCQRFDLRRIALGALVERLALIAETEKVSIEQDALVAVARGAEGGLRDAESALDQLISFCGDSITEADVLSVFGLISHRQLEDLVDAIMGGNMTSILSIIANLDDAGRDLHRLLVDLMEFFRNLLIVLSVGDKAVLQDVSEEQTEGVRRLASKTHSGRVLSVIDVLTDAEDRMKYALSRRSLLETALIRCGRAATVASLDEILKYITEMRGQVSAAPMAGVASSAPAAPVAPAVAAPAPATATPAPATATPAPAAATPAPAAAAPAPAAAATAPAAPPQQPRQGKSPEEELDLLLHSWSELIERVGRRSVIARGMLLDARPLRVDANTVIIAVDPEFADEKEQLEAGRNRKALEFALSDVLGRKVVPAIEVAAGDFVSVANVIAPKAANIPSDTAPATDALAPETVAPAALAPETEKKNSETVVDPVASASPKKEKRRWAEDDAVRMTLDVLNGTILDIRE
ncbi:MAG: DNA polymerase III subunit gamma/tau [Kiritimatiellae bacterium]|nr:DNA polymerase III subunit gamma/tau [Kiritimatiellia bacterium]